LRKLNMLALTDLKIAVIRSVQLIRTIKSLEYSIDYKAPRIEFLTAANYYESSSMVLYLKTANIYLSAQQSIGWTITVHDGC